MNETQALMQPPPCTIRLVDHGDPAALRSTVNVHAPLERIRGRVAAALFGGPSATPETIGRFKITRELGAGGMGIVYAAHDPQLDRTLAVKVLRHQGSEGSGDARLLREAQAMARLRHRNVLTVYEASTHQGQVYLAMEYALGGSLAEWIDAGARPWREVLATLIPAGRGLEAAHQAGLVHRDFKPANVLLDHDGHALVSDFGLARAGDELAALPGDELEETAGDDASQRLLQVVLTRTGALVGTPAYMSPEQFAGAPATPRSDQFAFCVVLFEALFGRRPFAGNTLPELVRAIEKGEVVSPPRAHAVPRAVRAAVLRGLSVEPARRFPSMAALLGALEDAQRRSVGRTTVKMIGAAVSGLLIGAGVLIAASDGREQAPAAAAVTPQNIDVDIERARTWGQLAASSARDLPPLIRCPSADDCVLRTDVLELMSDHPEALDARIIPVIRAGVHHGYKVYGIRARSPLKAAGFKNGDMITAIDDVSLATPDAPMLAAQAMVRARDRGRVEVAFERKGEAMRQVFTIVDGPEAPASPTAPTDAPAPPPAPTDAPTDAPAPAPAPE